MFVNKILSCQTERINDTLEDYRSLIKRFAPKEASESVAFGELPTWLNSVPKESKDNDNGCAMMLMSLAVINGPTDFNDIFSAFEQIKALCKGEKIPQQYDHKVAQHPFSFFRGTIFQRYLNPLSKDCPSPEFAKKVIKSDVSLRETKFGKWIYKKIGAKEVAKLPTKIESILHTEKDPDYVIAKVIKAPNYFSDLTARALLRTTKYGVGTIAVLNSIHAGYRIKEGKDPKEVALRAATGTVASVAAIGYLGAAGAKHCGTLGSLLGITVGSVIGEKIGDAVKLPKSTHTP